MKTKTYILTVLLSACPLLQGATEVSNDARDHLANTKSFITKKRSKLAIKSRSMDIFGLPQNPKRAREAQVNVQQRAVTQVKDVPFQKIVDTLPVTLMNPGSNLLILEGAGTIRAGRTIEFAYEGNPVQLRLEGVRSNGAYFRDLKSRKLILLSNQKLASGIKQGSGITPSGEGIQRVDLNKPASINIDLNSLDIATDRGGLQTN